MRESRYKTLWGVKMSEHDKELVIVVVVDRKWKISSKRKHDREQRSRKGYHMFT